MKHTQGYTRSYFFLQIKSVMSTSKNFKTSQTTQLTTESIDKESTTQELVYLSSSLTPNEESARLYQDTDSPKTSSHM